MNKQKFIQIVEDWCEKNNTSKKQLCRDAGIDLTYLCQIEIGRNKNPLALNLYKLCKTMNISLEKFIEDIYGLS